MLVAKTIGGFEFDRFKAAVERAALNTKKSAKGPPAMDKASADVRKASVSQ